MGISRIIKTTPLQHDVTYAIVAKHNEGFSMSPSIFGFLNLGTGELVLIFAVVMLLFGSKKLPELAKSLGQSVSEFKNSTSDISDLKDKATGQAQEAKEKLDGFSKLR